MEEREPAKKVLCNKPGRNEDRRRGRSKLRMCDDELEEVVARAGCIGRINAQTRKEWQKVIEDAKAKPRMYYQWKRKKEKKQKYYNYCDYLLFTELPSVQLAVTRCRAEKGK
jgi:hypothetical protein